MGVLLRNESLVGGIDSSLVSKIGTTPLNTTAQNLSDAINEHEYSIVSVISDLNDKADKATTLSGYGITDANISNGIITLGNNTITPLTSHQDISGKVNKSGDTMTGNLVIGNSTIYSTGSNGGLNSVIFGDDVYLGDCNASGMLGMKSTGTNCGIRLYDSSGNLIGGFQSTNGTPQWINSSGTATTISLNGHTHSYLPLSGGTVTGNILFKFTGCDASKANNNVSSTQYPTTYNILDNSSRILSRLESVIEANGNIGTYLYTRNYNTSGSQVAQKGLKMTMNKSGTLTWSIDDAANFRSALGLSGAATNGQYSRSSTGGLDWGTNNNYLVQKNVLAFWNGTYDGTSSNLQRCNRGAFGTIVTKNTGDYLATSGNGSLSGTITNNGYFKQKCQGLTGICASGRNDGHTYQFNWNSSSKLEFWVDNTNVGTLSDKRLKHNIKELTYNEPILDVIESCKMYTYQADNRNDQFSIGIMAQDFKSECEKRNLNPSDYEVFGTMQYTNDDDTEYYTIEYDQFLTFKCAILEKTINRLEAEINELKSKIE